MLYLEKHWECRLFMAVFNYAISTNYMWIFVEGLYLHTLIFMEIFLETSCVTWYIVFGWSEYLFISLTHACLSGVVRISRLLISHE